MGGLADEDRDAVDDALQAESEGAGRVAGGAVFGAGCGIDEQVAKACNAIPGKAPIKRNRFIQLSEGTHRVNL